MPGRPRRSTALIDDPEMPGAHELDQDATPAKRGPGRPRKATTATPAKRGPGRPPGTVKITAARTSGGQVMSVAQMKDAVAGELGMLATLLVGVIEMRDPDMGSAFMEPISMGPLGEVDPIDGMVVRTVNLLARNQKYLAYAAKGGVLTDILGLLYIGGTVARRIAAVSAYRRNEQAEREGLDGRDFPAYDGAAA